MTPWQKSISTTSFMMGNSPAKQLKKFDSSHSVADAAQIAGHGDVTSVLRHDNKDLFSRQIAGQFRQACKCLAGSHMLLR